MLPDAPPFTKVLQGFREHHRLLLLYNLYLLANQRLENEIEQDEIEYSKYRGEMIRLNRTLLYAQKEVYAPLLQDDGVEE